MNSKQEIYQAMQRVMNDITAQDKTGPSISFIEVARLLAKIGHEKAEPDLIYITNTILSFDNGKGICSISEHEVNKKKIIVQYKNNEKQAIFIENTKEQLFYLFINFITKRFN